MLYLSAGRCEKKFHTWKASTIFSFKQWLFRKFDVRKKCVTIGRWCFFQLKFFFWMKIFDSDTKWSNDKWSHVQNFNQKFYQYHLYHYKNAFKYQNTKIKRYCWHSTWNAQFFSTTFSFLLKMHFLFTEYKRQRKKCLEWKRKKMLDYNQIGLKELKQLKRSNKINENKIMKSKNVLITLLLLSQKKIV